MLFYAIDVSVDRYKVFAINGSKKNYKKEIKTLGPFIREKIRRVLAKTRLR